MKRIQYFGDPFNTLNVESEQKKGQNSKVEACKYKFAYKP